jgi:hypothetical protein
MSGKNRRFFTIMMVSTLAQLLISLPVLRAAFTIRGVEVWRRLYDLPHSGA